MNKTKDIITNLKGWQKWAIGIVLFTIIGFVSVLMMKPDPYQVLYSNLSAESSQAIISELSKMGVEYQTADNGATISVDKTKVASVRMQLASLGLPDSQDPGFELYDSNSLGATKDEKDIKYKRALKGQLEKDLKEGIDVVKSANVTLDFSNDTNLFTDEKSESKATVVLGLESGKTLNASQIKGIQNLVASGVPGMEPDKVVILDEQGNMISDLATNTDSTTAGSDKQSDILAQTEGRIKSDITKEMSTVFGYDKVNVTVRAKYNFDEIVQNIEKYDPKGTLASRQSNKDQTVSVNGNVQVEPGTESNGDVPDYKLENGTANSLSTEKKEELIENWEVGKTVETIKKNPELTYLSVSVAVDEELSPTDVTALEKHVAVSAGLIDSNKDGIYENGEVIVTPFTFKQKTVTDSSEQNTTTSTNEKLSPTMVGIFAGIIVLLVAFISIFASRRKKRREDEVAAREEYLTSELKAAQNANSDLVDQIQMSNNQVQIEESPSEIQRREDLVKEATDVAEENPKRTAEYLNKLINEG